VRNAARIANQVDECQVRVLETAQEVRVARPLRRVDDDATSGRLRNRAKDRGERACTRVRARTVLPQDPERPGRRIVELKLTDAAPVAERGGANVMVSELG